MMKYAMILAGVLAAAPAHAAVDECSIRYPFGTVTLKDSNPAIGQYGADLRFLYGDWDWNASFGLNVAVGKFDHYVGDIAGLVRDCVGDLRHGRLDFSRHQTVDEETGALRLETDAEFYERVFDDTVEVRRELATVEVDYDALLQAHAPLIAPGPSPTVSALKSIVNETVLRMLDRIADRTTGLGWIVVNMQSLHNALEQFKTANNQTRQLITLFLQIYPQMRDLVIAQLVNNVKGVVDQYGAFFSAERQATLQGLIDAVVAEGGDPDTQHMVQQLSQLSNSLEGQVLGVRDAGEPLHRISLQLKLVFGLCNPAPGGPTQMLDHYFGDLAMTSEILEEDSDDTLCTP